MILYIGDDRPDTRDLHRYVVEQQAALWDSLGIELGLAQYHIDNIARDHSNESVTQCCAKMLQKWLDIDPFASWRKLDDAVRRIRSPKSPTVSSDSTGILFS